MSPLSNNKLFLNIYYYFVLIEMGVVFNKNRLFLKYSKSPFFDFFKIGINVTLSTDDPLILHMTNDPLLEEYAISA